MITRHYQTPFDLATIAPSPTEESAVIMLPTRKCTTDLLLL